MTLPMRQELRSGSRLAAALLPNVRQTCSTSWGGTAEPGAARGLLVWLCNPHPAHHSRTVLVQAQQQLERSQAQARQRQASEAQREVSSHPSTRQDPSVD